MAFDPSKPAEVVFDPSKPAEVVEEPAAAPAPLPPAPALSGGPTQRYPMRIPTDEQAGVASGPIVHPVTWKDRIGMAATPEEAAAARARRPADPMEVDPIAQALVAGTLAAGGGALARPALAAVMPAAAAPLVPAAVGATEGAIASKAQGGSALEGAALGAIPGLAGAGASVAKKGLAAAGAKLEERAAETAFKKLGRGAGVNQGAKLEAVGPKQVAEVSKEFGIAKAPDPRAAIVDAKKQVGAVRDAAYEAIDSAGGGVDLEQVDRKLAGLEASFRRSAATKKFADDVAGLRSSLVEQHGAAQPDLVRVTGGSSGSAGTPAGIPGVRVVGGSAGSPAPPELVALGNSRGASLSGMGATYEKIPGSPAIPGAAPEAPTFTRVPQPRAATGGRISVAQLQREISAIDEGAYGGSYANPKAATILKRRTSAALRGLLDEHLETVATKSPEAAQAVDAFYDANRKFQALKAMEPIVKTKTVRARFAPSFVDKLIAKPVSTLAHAATDIAHAGAERGLGGAARAGATAAGAVERLASISPIAPISAGTAAVTPNPEEALQQLVARADGGDAQAAAKLAALIQRAPLLAARVQAIRRRGAMP